jgi:hypothetical protein
VSPFTESLSRFYRSYTSDTRNTTGAAFFAGDEDGDLHTFGSGEQEEYALLPIAGTGGSKPESEGDLERAGEGLAHRRRKNGRMKFG